MTEETDTNTTDEEVVEQTETVVEEQAPKKTAKVEVKERPVTKRREDDSKDDHDESNDLKYENIQRRKENRELKRQMAERDELINSLRAEFDSMKKTSEARVVRATLSSALNKAGCVDPEVAMSMIAEQVEFDKNGDIVNDGDLIEGLKAKKTYLFTGPATTQTQAKPKPAAPNTNVVASMSDEEFKRVLKSKGVRVT